MQIEKSFLEDIEKVYGKPGVVMVEKAFSFANKKHFGQERDSGDAYITHPYNVAKILFEMRADIPSIVSGLLHDCLKCTECTEKEIEDNFGSEICNIIIGLSKFDLIKQSRITNMDEVENLRKVVLTLGKDARVAFVKMADRLHNIQTLGVKSREKQIKIAQETLDIFVPLAERLGMNKVKHKLEDLCFMYIYPEEYNDVKKYLEEYYKKRETINNDIAKTLEELAKEHNVSAVIQSRIKSSFGVFKKQAVKGRDSIYDIIAHRIIVKEIKDCYTMLGAVHEIWKPVEGRIKDYIATPKKNLYMSLHTTVYYPTEDGGKIPFEIQIRTEEMHIFCEYGMAAHWMYKENGSKITKFDGNSAMLEIKKKLQTQNDEVSQQNETEDFLNIIKTGFYEGTIFVFTPQLKVIELPDGSNSIDFAYAVHSSLGNKCVGAKINGKMVPINTKLQTADVVEILTSSTSKGPSRDWLKICKSRGAIAKIKNYFKKEKREENIKIGKDILEEQLKRKGYSLSKFLEDKDSLNEIALKNTLLTIEDIYAAVGYGGVTTAQILGKFVSKQKQRDKMQNKLNRPKKVAKGLDGIIVEGQGDMLKRVAKCCNPIPGDNIVGYISRGRGVTIHKCDCPTLAHLEKERIVETAWDDSSVQDYVADFKVLAKGSANILNLISNKIADNKIEISYINSERNRNGDAVLTVGVLINSREQIDELINKIGAMPEVYEVYR